ncbi:DedA family protein [Streptosporangium amethystogenes]|uniref:DedA family protein n=1 Tax=Streptosporangium amethystogenes TaxID=2002 RepID=UPI0037B93F48
MFRVRSVAAGIPDPASAAFLGMPLWLWVIVGGVALFGAFQVYYWVGHVLGSRLYTSRLGVKIGQENILRVEKVVRKWGALAVYACFWVPGLRHTLPWVAGVLRISYPWYVVASALGCLTWVPVTSFGLYSVIWGWLELVVRSPLLAGLVAVAAVAAIAWFVRRRRRRVARSEVDSPAVAP